LGDFLVPLQALAEHEAQLTAYFDREQMVHRYLIILSQGILDV